MRSIKILVLMSVFFLPLDLLKSNGLKKGVTLKSYIRCNLNSLIYIFIYIYIYIHIHIYIYGFQDLFTKTEFHL